MNLVDELHAVAEALTTVEGSLDDRIEVSLPEGPLAVVSRTTLLRMKRLAGRSQDLADIERLEGGHDE
jgi:hypothetical protein